MKKTLLLAALLSIISFHYSLCQAQRIHAFATSGVTLSQVEGDELKGFRQLGYVGGVGALTAISDNYRWGASVEVLFSQRGVYNDSWDPQNLYNIELTLNYVDIPLLLHYQDPYGGMLFGAGLCYGRLVQQHFDTIKFNPAYFIPDTTDRRFLPHDLCAVADMRFTVWRGLQLNLRWQYSLLPVKRDWDFYFYNGDDGEGNARYRHKSNNCYNHSLSIRLIWQF
ncbi:MAG: outer membrane beta-barrel protein [Bacteroidales bacterium]|nr:outer membrane beta-barrel protein [Bacteroidales bacterium]